MEKTNKSNSNTSPVLVLVILVVAVLIILFLLNLVVGSAIEANSGESFDASFEVLPTADAFEKADATLGDVDGVTVKSVFTASNGAGKTATVTVNGYGGPMDIVVGVDSGGAITGVKVMENTETEGIGSKATAPEHTSKFVGQGDGSAVEAVSGATVSSTAINKAVAAAYGAIAEVQ